MTTPASIIRDAKHAKAVKPKTISNSYGTFQVWTEAEDCMVRRMYLAGVSMKAIAARAGRSFGATRNRISVLRQIGKIDLGRRELIEVTYESTLIRDEEGFARAIAGRRFEDHPFAANRPWRPVFLQRPSANSGCKSAMADFLWR